MKFVRRPYYRIPIILIFYIIGIDYIYSSSTIDTTLKRKKLIALPVVYYTPDTRWGFGAAGVFSFNFKTDTLNARYSNISFGFAYTQNKQLSVYIPYQLYLLNRKVWIYGELGFYNYIYSFYGIGNNSPIILEEKYSVQFPRIRIAPLIKLMKNHYLGMRFSRDQFKYLKYDTSGQLIAQSILGSISGTSSNLGIIYNFDSRDIPLYPSKGILFESYIYVENKWLGSDYQFSKISLDFSQYMNLKKNLIFATNIIHQISFSDVPFHQLPTIGGPKKLRGYIDGRYRDKMLLILQFELRQKLNKYLGMVAFWGIGEISPNYDELKLKYIYPNFGVGLRIVLDQKQKYNLRLDYGFGKNSNGFYLTLGEAF